MALICSEQRRIDRRKKTHRILTDIQCDKRSEFKPQTETRTGIIGPVTTDPNEAIRVLAQLGWLFSIVCGLRPVTYNRSVLVSACALEFPRNGEAAVPAAVPPAKSAAAFKNERRPTVPSAFVFGRSALADD